MKDVSIKLSTILTVLTIVGILVAGGVAFGELKAGLTEQDKRIQVSEARLLEMQRSTDQINEKITEVATDLKWIRVLIEEYARKVHAAEDQADTRGYNKPIKQHEEK